MPTPQVRDAEGIPILSVAKATDNLRRKIAKLSLAEEKAAEARREWGEALLLAQMAGATEGKGNLTVPQLSVLAGKSAVRIEQVLKAEREARGISKPSKKTNPAKSQGGHNASV